MANLKKWRFLFVLIMLFAVPVWSEENEEEVAAGEAVEVEADSETEALQRRRQQRLYHAQGFQHYTDGIAEGTGRISNEMHQFLQRMVKLAVVRAQQRVDVGQSQTT